MSDNQLGIVLGLLSSVSFVLFSLWGREVQHREGPWRYMVYISVGPAVAGMLTWLAPDLRPDFSWPLVRSVCYAAVPALLGLFFMGLACRWGDISHVGPVMGSKALMASILAVTLGFEPVVPAFWAASAMLVVALFLVSGNPDLLRRPWRIIERALVLGLLMCVFTSLSDLITRQQMDEYHIKTWDFLTVGWVVRGSFCLAVALVAALVGGKRIMPQHLSTLTITPLVVIAHGFVFVKALEYLHSAVLTNVLTSLRGMVAVVAVLLLARLGLSHREKLTGGMIAARVVGSLLICLAVWIGLQGRGEIKAQTAPVDPSHEATRGAQPTIRADDRQETILLRPRGRERDSSADSRPPTEAAPTRPSTLDDVYARMAESLRGGGPMVITVHVCLCDNRQGIVPVPPRLGNGDAPQDNLYWGAMYGVRTFLARSPAWKLLAERDGQGDLLKETVFQHRVAAGGAWAGLAADRQVETILVARAWRGMPVESALRAFARDVLTDEASQVKLPDGRTIAAGGAGHVVGFVGHNSLMSAAVREANLFAAVKSPAAARAKGWFVLACKSDDFFTPELVRPHAVRLLTTRQFMAPEAYTLAALAESLARRSDAATLRSSAAAAYAKYQKIAPGAAMGVFTN